MALKNRADFRYIGKPQRRLDSRIKVNGAAQFGIDVDLPNMLVAVVARPPQFGATVRSFDASQAKAVRGVVDVKQVPSGVAVIAEHTWAAIKGREALRVEWQDGPGATLSTESLRAERRALLARTGLLAKNQGDAIAALGEARRKIDVEYELPYLAHACMEPLNAVAWVKNERCEMWMGTQGQSQDAQLVAAALPVHVPGVAVVAYCAGMALFTILLGNAFAAFPVMTLGVGLPFIVKAHGGDPAVMGTLGMLSGYCGTLVTPMAANFNLVPARLLELRDDFAVIKAQVPFAAAIWVFNVVVMYVCVFRR